MNPYAPPLAELPTPTRGPRRGLSGWIYAFVAAHLVSHILYVLAVTRVLALLPTIIVSGFASLAAAIVGISWLGLQWARLPSRAQLVANRPVSQRQVVWRHFIPLYGIYWMFVVNKALCEGIDSILARKRRPAERRSG